MAHLIFRFREKVIRRENSKFKIIVAMDDITL
jgi:hypothetical protein